MKRVLSLLMALVMVVAILPTQVFAEGGEELLPAETPVVESVSQESIPEEEIVPAEEETATVEEEVVPAEEETAAVEEVPQQVCEEGCILEGEEEHAENGGACLVWTSCTQTEGCQGPAGHEGDCYGMAVYAGSITVSGNTYRNKYVVVGDELYYVNSSGVIQNTDGSAATFENGTYTVYYGMGGSGSGRGNESTFASGTVTVGGNATVYLSAARVSTSTAYATRVRYATSLFYNTASFDHVDVRVAGSYVIHVGSQEYNATVSNPTAVVKVGGTTVASQVWTGSTSYEWRQTGLSLTKSRVITIELKLDLTYTDSKGQTHVLEDVQITYDSVNNVDKFIDAIAICDMIQGLDFRVSVEDIEEEIQYYSVSYEWKVYDTHGVYTELPAGAPSEPATTRGHVAGEEYVYDTEYVTGTSFYDYDAGLLYTFHGWDTYSHSSVYNPVVSTGYHALDDGDTVASNNKTIEITADTYIYGYWTVSELEPSSAHIAIEKVFIVDGVEVSLEEAEDLWFRIDTGIDRDGDGDTEIDVDYTMIAASAGGEYKIPVYQYDAPFVFTEYNAEVPGYTRTTTVTVSGDHILGYTQSGDSVSVTMDPVYQGENVHLGTVTYTNTYTKRVGTPVDIYPELTVVKSAADTGLAQEGVVFTLYRDSACTDVVTAVTTGSGGIGLLDFTGLDVGTYYLQETAPLDGYIADPCVYAVTLSVSKTVEELRNGEYVPVTYYALSVNVPADSTASYYHSGDYYRLHIYNQPVQGSLELRKTILGLAEEDKEKLRAVVIVHGPITRSGGAITDIGATWQLELNEENGFAATLEDLPLGEYLIHESFASVHGYTWTGVTYGALNTEEYNGIVSGVFAVKGAEAVELELTNSYEEWTEADFYIKKVDENGKALAGAIFQLYNDAGVVDTKTTGADGYAHFSGYTVPEGQTSVIYYLKEIQAPAGYYLSDTVYRVEITAVTVNGKTGFEPTITPEFARTVDFDIATDLLTVTNYPVLGKLLITKVFTGGIIPQSLTELSVEIDGPNGFTRTVKLNNENGWAVTLEELPLGQYTITELDANVPGYTWTVSYSAATVTLAEEDPGMTTPGTEIGGEATVTNTYTPNEEFFEIPTSLTVKKVGESGEALAGAVFTLEKEDGTAVSFTTGADGIVVFDLLTGSIENGAPVDGKYTLSETKAPEGYRKTETTWTVTVSEDDGEVRVVLNENKNVFENIWDWVVGDVSGDAAGDWSWADGVLSVTNHRIIDVSVNKVWYGQDVTHPDAVKVTLYCDGEAFDTVTLNEANGWSHTWEGLDDDFVWTVDEPNVPAGYNKTVRSSGNHFTITNTYKDIPKTGDFTSMLGMGTMTVAGLAGFGFSAASLLKPRKKEEEEE